MSSSTQATPPPENALARATSPYLRQHAHNPVAWREWGAEALAAAQREQKPIFLSIGYAACHWCHLMAHESFEDPHVAAVLNEHFINIKVDREERPDLDAIYMQATLVLNHGQGGWPMSVWLTPEGRPFFAGTYFPPTSRWGRPGFKEICERIAEAWRADRPRIEAGAQQLTEIVRAGLAAAPANGARLDRVTIDAAAAALAAAFDRERGGLLSGATNKFPPSMALDVLLRAAWRRPAGDPERQQYLDCVHVTLRNMARGGIFDQLGGGIHRYSTDPDWHVPHFEKMLYDQALVSRIYLDAWQATGERLYRQVACETLHYVLSDLQAPEGGFYCARDADSEGEEGRYYVWTRAEILDLLGPEDGELLCAYYDVRAAGNWDDPHAPGAAKNVLRVRREVRCVSRMCAVPETECEKRLAAARAELLAARSRRLPPALDDKVLTEWNGLMIASLARGGAVLDEPGFITAATRAADFLLAELGRGGRLRRAWCRGRCTDVAFVTDYAALTEGLLELFEVTGRRRWLDRASELTRTALELFWDSEQGGFFLTAWDHEPLIARSKDLRDSAVPSGNSLMLMNLLRLAALLGEPEFRRRADEMLHGLAGEIAAAPLASERFLAGVEFAMEPPVEIALVGEPESAELRALRRAAYSPYLPNRVIALGRADAPDAVPLLRGRPLVGGRPTAYVCIGGTCRAPTNSPDELTQALTAGAAAVRA